MTTRLTVHSLEPALTDNLVFQDIAATAEISAEALRCVLAQLDDLEVRQISRLCKMAKARRIADVNRQTRKQEERR